MRENLKIMGMKTSAYALSYFAAQSLFFLGTSASVTLVFALLKFVSGATNILVFFLALALFGQNLIMLVMCISTFYPDSKLSVQVGSLTLLLPLCLFIAILNLDHSYPWRLQYGYMIP